jgi:hypothetical protein
MSELIDRKALIKQLKDENIPFNADINEIINIQPIAFDVANIVEKLRELKMRYFLTIANTGDDKNDFAYENVGNALDHAINIVKQELNKEN